MPARAGCVPLRVDPRSILWAEPWLQIRREALVLHRVDPVLTVAPSPVPRAASAPPHPASLPATRHQQEARRQALPPEVSARPPVVRVMVSLQVDHQPVAPRRATALLQVVLRRALVRLRAVLLSTGSRRLVPIQALVRLRAALLSMGS